MKLNKQIKKHCKNQQYVEISRLELKENVIISRGYIIAFSKDLVLLQEIADFRLLGFNVIEKSKITSIRNNKNDKFYDKIMKREGLKSKIGLKTDLHLGNWKTLFKQLRKANKNVIVECEGRKYNFFTIGNIVKIKKNCVHLRYFNALGIFDKTLTKINYKSITNVTFDDRYIEVFQKYLKNE